VLHKVTPVYEELPGWRKDLTSATDWTELPRAAQDYIHFVAEQGGVPVTMVGVGPGRNQLVRTHMEPLADGRVRGGEHDDDDGDDGDWDVASGVVML
jgi:hypothetical protein